MFCLHKGLLRVTLMSTMCYPKFPPIWRPDPCGLLCLGSGCRVNSFPKPHTMFTQNITCSCYYKMPHILFPICLLPFIPPHLLHITIYTFAQAHRPPRWRCRPPTAAPSPPPRPRQCRALPLAAGTRHAAACGSAATSRPWATPRSSPPCAASSKAPP